MHFHRAHQRSQGFRLWHPKSRSAFTSRDKIFDEKSMLQERSEMGDKTQGGALDSSINSQAKEVDFQLTLKSLMG